MTDIHDVVQAFADGEAVDPEVLDAALADRDGRAHLIDLLVLRGFMRNPSLAPPVTVGTTRTVARPLRWLSIAALFAIATTFGGYVVGEHAAATRRANSDLSTTADASSATAAAPIAIDPPAPTQVIRFEPGVDWTEHKGGH